MNRRMTMGGAAVALVAGLAAATAGGCGGDDGDTSTTESTKGSGAASSASGTGASGGTGGTGGTGGGTGGAPPTMLTSVTPVATDAIYATAFDATMSLDGSIVYFTALGPDGPGVFSVPAAGGTVAKVFAGSPLAAPFGIALSSDGKTLYVADPAALGTAGDKGAIFSVSAEGGTLTQVMGTADSEPRGLDVVAEAGKDQIFFSGSVAGAVGIYKVPVAGGVAAAVATGAPFNDPAGVAVTKSGTIYVIDTIASATHLASVIAVTGTTATAFLPNLRVGYPAGIALSLDEKSILLSSLGAKGQSSIQLVDILSKEASNFPADDSLAGQVEPGGLHRARGVDRFAWVSYKPAGGSVLVVK